MVTYWDPERVHKPQSRIKIRGELLLTPEEKIQEQARKLGGGWRIERGIMPVVVLTTVEAARLILKLDTQERTIRKAAEEVDRIIDKLEGEE